MSCLGGSIMEWSKEAEIRINKAPFFIRNIAKKKAEEVAKNRGKNVVDIRDIEIAKKNKELYDLSTMDLSIDGMVNSSFREMILCGGVKGCPLTLFNDAEVAKIFDKVLKEESLDDVLSSKIDRPILYHNKFKTSISGCPNNCAHPQIKDISIVGYSIPKVNQGLCISCHQCVSSCPEGLINLYKDPEIDFEGCIDCEKCVSVCPTESISIAEKGYRIFIGGRLGRKPHLAKKFIDVQSTQELEVLLRKLVALYKQCVIEGKNFSKTVENSTIEDIQRSVGVF
jgi:dissimilatory sulfite reductase (desulfoviridin) alpha/beta subunit